MSGEGAAWPENMDRWVDSLDDLDVSIFEEGDSWSAVIQAEKEIEGKVVKECLILKDGKAVVHQEHIQSGDSYLTRTVSRS